MPLRVTCQCGQAFTAPDHLAGKRVKCPKCSQPLAIPEAAPAKESVAARAKQAQKKAEKERKPGDSVLGLGPVDVAERDLFSEAGMHQTAAGTIPCPNCGKPMQPQAVLCVNCGFHKQMGKKLGTVTSGPAPGAAVAPGGGGHPDGGNAAVLLARAAATIEEDKLEEVKTRSQGMPWWGYAGLLVLTIIIACVFMKYGPTVGIMYTAYMLSTVLWMCQVYFAIRIYAFAFHRSAGEGLMVVFIPFYIFVYSYQHWDAVGDFMNGWLKCFAGQWICAIIYWIGVGVGAGVNAIQSQEETRLIIEHGSRWFA